MCQKEWPGQGTYGALAIRRMGAKYAITKTIMNFWGRQKRERELTRKRQRWRKRWKKICGTRIIGMIEDRLVARSP